MRIPKDATAQVREGASLQCRSLRGGLPAAEMRYEDSSAPQAINADYTAPPVKRAMLNCIYRIVLLLFKLMPRRHIDRLIGLEHLPNSGPFIIVANHLSYMDDFLLAYVIRRHCGQKLYIPTNKKAFEGAWRSWLHLAGGAVEIDPGAKRQSYHILRQLIQDRKIILMFPEGTRSDGSHLLPFKFGAFNLARDLKVPIAPVALIDTHRVLPKHSLRLVKGAKASAVFLPTVTPDAFERLTVQGVKEACRDMLADSIYGERDWASKDAGATTARHLAARSEAVLESLIERGPETIRWADLQPVFDWADLVHYAQPDSYAMQVQYFRAWGFRLLSAPTLRIPFQLARFRSLGAAALRRDPHQPFVHYVHGQFHLRAPWLVGGRRRIAVATLDHAYRWAAKYEVDRGRFTVSYAEALSRTGHHRRAQRLLERDFGNCQPITERQRRRAARARALLNKLQSASL